MKEHLKIDTKCAPSKKYIDGSCFSYNSLIQIATSYNSRNTDKIDINGTKKEIVKKLETKLANKCSEQTCWLRLDFVKALDNEDINVNTFRPKGPQKKYEWLSTFDINNVIEQYQKKYNDFLFLGAVPYDFDDLPILGISTLDFADLEKQGKHRIGIVFNLDEHYKNGSHWVALYANLIDNQIYFFDSVGKKPLKRIRKFINKIAKYLYYKKYNQDLNINDIILFYKDNSNKQKKHPVMKNLIDHFDIRYNNIQHQFKDTECGVYSIFFITRLIDGESFDSIINNVIKDDEMNLNRKLFFRNVV